MGQQLHPPEPVKLIVGMLSSATELFVAAEAQMAALWGAIDIVGAVLPFGQTRYYEDEMGPGLLRKFVAFGTLIDPGALAEMKHASNRLEQELAAEPAGRALGVARPINLDPGYLDSSKLVLATTKNYSHRIYIGRSMYAEATLHYHKGRWAAWPYTYPDYAGGAYEPFLNAARRRLREQLSSRKAPT